MTASFSSGFEDVRGKGFGPLAAVAEVLSRLDARTRPLPSESVSAREAGGRVLAASVVAEVNVPGFRRAAMDGYAVRAADAIAADELLIVGQSRAGHPFPHVLQPGQAVQITTGAPLPEGADAVVRLENATPLNEKVLIREAVMAGRNIGQVGEDVAAGREVLPAGRRLRPQDVGLLAAIGAGGVDVVRPPNVALLVTGDELLPPGSKPDGCRIVDSNSPMLAALVERDGGRCRPAQYVPDRYERVCEAIRNAVESADAVLVSGGTSVGEEDHVPRAVATLGELSVHGIAIKPARPTGIGFIPWPGREAPIFLLPGNPVACLCAYDLFAGRVIRRLGGRPWGLPYHRETLPLAGAFQSEVGRVDYVRCRVVDGRVEPMMAGGASLLRSTVAADGFFLTPAESDRLAEGEMVEVWFYD